MAESMKFPLENQERFKGSVSFQAIQTIPPEISVSKKLYTNLASGAVDAFRPSESSENIEETLPDPEPSSEQLKVEPLKLKILDGRKVSMYLPMAFVVNDTVSYDTPELGVTGAAGLQALSRTGDITSAVGQAITTGVSGLKDMFASGSSLTGQAARIAVARGSAFIPNQTARNVIQSAAQVTVNPNVRAMFRGVALREFTFQFKLIPTSPEEANEIKRIIRFFRYHAYPENIEIEGVPIAYAFPDMFKIRLQYNNNPVGTRIKMCYLRSVSTNYNPQQSSFFKDGNPTEIDLTLSFVENRTINRQDIGESDLAADDGTDGASTYLDEGNGF